MPMVDGDWTITRSNGNIRYIGADHDGAATYATVIEFHRWLQDFADDASSSGDDELDITDSTPSDRSTDNIITLLNGYNIDANAAEHLYDGSIIQDSGDTIYDGIVNFGNASVQIQLLQDGALLSDDWWNEAGAGLNADANAGISHRFMILVRSNGVDIDGRRLIGTSRTFGNTYSEFSINGTARGNNVLALVDSTDLNNQTAAGTVALWTGITNTEGLRDIDINGDGSTEEYYSEWNTNQPTRSINEFYERMKWLTRDGTAETLYGLNGEVFRGITHSFAYDGETGTPPATGEEVVWGTAIAYDNEASGPFVVGDAVREDTATPTWTGRILAVDDNGADGTLIVDVRTGTVTDNESFTSYDATGAAGATGDVNGTPTVVSGGGSMAVLAIDDNGTTGDLYVQVLKGTAPSDDVILYTDDGAFDVANNLTVNGTVTERTVSTPFIGVSTGSALIGAYGIGLEAADTSASDTFFDLTNTQITPPNNVTFTVFGLVSGEDRVLVTNAESGGIDFDQMTLATALTGAAETVVDVGTSNIPADTPSPSGILRIELDDGRYRRVPYTNQNGDDNFTIASTDFSGGNSAASSNNVFLAYIDELASGATATFTTVYDSDRTLFVRVRDGDSTPIRTFETTGTLGSSGGSATAIRTSDE